MTSVQCGGDGASSRDLSRDPGAPRGVYWVTREGYLLPQFSSGSALLLTLHWSEALKTTACETYLTPPVEKKYKKAATPP